MYKPLFLILTYYNAWLSIPGGNMSKRSIRFVLVVMLIQSMLFSTIVHAEQLLLPAADVSAPEVNHKPIIGPIPVGATHQLKATVSDNVGVDGVSLFYRQVGDSQYQRKTMLRETNDSDVYSITLGTKDLAVPGIEYYIQATDLAGNSVLYGYSFEPIKLNVMSGAEVTTVKNESTFDEVLNGDSKENKKGGFKWVWIALGALAVGAVAAAASGGGGDDGGGGDSGTVTVSGPVPQ
jgi:hypothetical protein